MKSAKKPLRVLILTYIYTDGDPRYGGEGRVVWETTQALARRGVKVYVATSMYRVAGTYHPNILVYKVPFAKKDFLNFNHGELLKMFFFCIPLILFKRIDIVHHLPTNGPNPFARLAFGRVFAQSADPAWDYQNPKFGEDLRLDNAGKSKEAGFVKRSFDLSSRLALRLWRALGVLDKFPRGTDIFFYRARSLYAELKRLRPESEMMYVPNGVDTTAFNPHNLPLFKRSGVGLRFLHVGSISRRKGVHYLVQAFLEVVKKHPESELMIVGRGETEFVEELKRMATGYPQVQFHHNISNDKLPNVYTSADVFCLVPLSGSTPTVMGEAFASGLPVIGTKESGSGEAIEEHDAGLLCEPGDATALASVMFRFIEEPGLREEKSQNALKAAQFFSWDNVAKLLEEGYRLALTKKHRA